LRQEFLSHTLCIIEFPTSLAYQASIVQQGAIRIYHLISHPANQHLAILLLLRPEAHILILLLKLLNLFTIKVEVNAVILITHRADDGILDEIGIQLGVEEDILDGAGDIQAKIKRYYDAIEDHQTEYDEYYQGIGFHLEAGDGYFFFSRKETKGDLQRKLEAVSKWIDYLTFLKTYNSAFGSGLVFSAADIVVRINCDMELKELAGKLFSEKKSYDEIVDKLIGELVRMGFIEQQDEVEKNWKVLTSFHYIEELIDCISITDDADITGEEKEEQS
jgi:hypothetical protein